MSSQIYLDYAATSPIRPEAMQAFIRGAEMQGNASAQHSSGRRVKLELEEARDTLARTIGAHPSEILFTSGGTESDNLALKGLYWAARDEDPARNVIILTGIEHAAVLETAEWLESHEGAQIVQVPVDAVARVDMDAFQQALTEHAGKIAVATMMWANNEVGTVQPIAELAEMCLEAGVNFHVDAVQAFGAIDAVSFAHPGITTMAITGHKIGAPVGIGALLVRREAKLTPLLHGGGQERDIRSGTFTPGLILSFAAAAEAACQDLSTTMASTAALRDKLIDGIQQAIPAAQLQGARDTQTPGENRLPNNAHFTFPGCEGDTILFGLDMAGIATSTGSACSAGVSRPSTVLLSTGADEDTARSTQRFTLGHGTSEADIDALLDVIAGVYEAGKKAGMAAEDSSIRTANSHRSR